MKPIDRINRNTEELFRAFRTISADNMSTRAYIETINGDIEETARLYPQDLSNRFEEFAKKWIDALVAEAKFQATRARARLKLSWLLATSIRASEHYV